MKLIPVCPEQCLICNAMIYIYIDIYAIRNTEKNNLAHSWIGIS